MIFFKLAIVLTLINGDIQSLEGVDFKSRQGCLIFMYEIHPKLVKKLKGKVYKIDLNCTETRTA